MRLLTVLLCTLLWLPACAAARESCAVHRDAALYARVPVAPAAGGELAIATQNLLNLFDDEQDANERPVSTAQFRARIDRIARYVARDLGAPAVLAVQEVEDDTSLKALVAALGRETGRGWQYVAGEVSGGRGDIRSALVLDARLSVIGSHSLFSRTPRAGKTLHDRLPLVVDLDAGPQGKLRVVVVHMKSMKDLDSKDAEDAARVKAKRRFQADELAQWLRGEVAANRRLVVIGDFNATLLNDDERAAPLKALLARSGMQAVAPRFLKPSQRWTYKYRCELNELDHALVSPALAGAISGYAIARGDTCLRARGKCDKAASVSDHDGVVLWLR